MVTWPDSFIGASDAAGGAGERDVRERGVSAKGGGGTGEQRGGLRVGSLR